MDFPRKILSYLWQRFEMIRSTYPAKAVFFLMIILIPGACTKSGKTYSGEIILSSEFNFETATLSGYNFEDEAFYTYPAGEHSAPDIIVDQFRLLDGSIKPGFTSPDNLNGFALAGSFIEGEASMAFYNSLLTVEAFTSFSQSTDTVKPFQVWVLKTARDSYAKLRVSDIREVDDSYGTHLELTIDYYYRPDGSTEFPK